MITRQLSKSYRKTYCPSLNFKCRPAIHRCPGFFSHSDQPLLNNEINRSSAILEGLSVYKPIRIGKSKVSIPKYLHQHYWWAYINPRMISILDKQFLVDIVLWGNFVPLRNAAMEDLLTVNKYALPPIVSHEVIHCHDEPANVEDVPIIYGKTLQISCVYANFTETIVERLSPKATLDVVDVVPEQLNHLQKKLCRNKAIDVKKRNSITLSCCNATRLPFCNDNFDTVIIFFLLHETPNHVRYDILAEAFRVLKGHNVGKLVIIDYHKPETVFWQFVMKFMYKLYEPFALDLWNNSLTFWVPSNMKYRLSSKFVTYFDGLYQKVVATKN